MLLFPKSKINLGLRITGKRSDGYHDIETIFYPVSLCDALEFVVSPEQRGKDILTVTGFDTGDNLQDNLVIRTINKLRECYSFPLLKLHLHKAIPVGAGLGGGSSDAACLLKGLNRYFGLKLNEDDLKAIALGIGSDCPFFIDSSPAYATGRGEILKPIEPVLNGYYLIILNPGTGVNTREAYHECHPEQPSTSLLNLINSPAETWKDAIINDFEEYVFKRHPAIAGMKHELYKCGALYSSMSGSGSSVFGLFPAKPFLSGKLKKSLIFGNVV